MNSPSGPKKINHSMQTRGDAIRADRIAQGLTQEALVELCRSQGAYFSIQSLRRAERGERVASSTVTGIAQALGQDISRYVREPAREEAASADRLVGAWLALSVEDDRLSAPYILQEDVEISLDATGGLIITTFAKAFKRHETSLNVVLMGDMLMGQYQISGWPHPLGMGTFQLQTLREDTMLEGYTTWYDTDSHRIEASKLIMLRKGMADFDTCLAAASRLIEAELVRFADR